MIHARAPHFLWPYGVRYAANQLNFQPRVSRPEASPTSLWTGSPGVGLVFHVWGYLALVRDTSADKLSARAIPCVFLGFPVDSPNYTFYHPPLHQFLDSRDIWFDESLSYYACYSCRGLTVPVPPLFLAPSPPPTPVPPVPLLPPGPAPSGSPQQPSALPRQVTMDSGGIGAGGAATGCSPSRGDLLRIVGTGGAGTGGASSGVLELEVLALEVLLLGVLELEVLALEVLVLGVLELEVLALEVLVLGLLEQAVLALEVLVPGRLELEALLLRLPTTMTHVSRRLVDVSVRSKSGWRRRGRSCGSWTCRSSINSN
ncbi:unnamed protein product [Closterium sp. NIES-53]